MADINVSSVSTGEVIEEIFTYYTKMLEAGYDYKEIRPVMLFGPTGVGKSSGVYELAELIKKHYKCDVVVNDIRLTTCTITDLNGIPAPNKDRTETVWLKPEIYKQQKGKNTIHIFFFDELDKAQPAVQAAALQLILDRKAWTHDFPERSFVIAAANPARRTKKNETKMLPELMNRFRHFNVKPDFESFRRWGIANDIHPYVLGYLSYNNSKLYASSESESIAFPTPRSWTSISNMLKAYDGSFESVEELHNGISAEIGTGDAIEFESWCEAFYSLPDTYRIFEGKEKKFNKSPDVLYALVGSMIMFISSKSSSIAIDELRNACKYVDKFPADFRALFYRYFEDIDSVKALKFKVPEYMDYVKSVVNR